MFQLGKSFAKNLIDNSSTTKKAQVIELLGDIGAGKTTFARGLAKGLKIKQLLTSPSFTISKSYALKNGGRLIHYDFYRLPDPGLMLEDLRENLENPKNIIIIEWGRSIENILPKKHIKLSINKLADESREILQEIKNSPENDSPTKNSNLSKIPHKTQHQNNQIPKNSNRLSMFLDTSTPETILKLNDKEYRYVFANDLAEKLLAFINKKLKENNKTLHDLTEITFMSGPGSFTGLRIGATIVNTLSNELNIPLYDHNGNQHKVLLPDYGKPANISTPRK